MLDYQIPYAHIILSPILHLQPHDIAAGSRMVRYTARAQHFCASMLQYRRCTDHARFIHFLVSNLILRENPLESRGHAAPTNLLLY